MNDIEFKKGMIAGLKSAKSIFENASTDTEIIGAINGAILVIELLTQDSKVDDEHPLKKFCGKWKDDGVTDE